MSPMNRNAEQSKVIKMFQYGEDRVLLRLAKRAIEDDLPKQFEVGFKKARTLYRQLFADSRLYFDQAGPWHKWENGVLLPPSNDEDEDAGGNEAIDGADDHNQSL